MVKVWLRGFATATFWRASALLRTILPRVGLQAPNPTDKTNRQPFAIAKARFGTTLRLIRLIESALIAAW